MTGAVSGLQEEVATSRAQLAAKGEINFRVSQKGALSVYGLQRYPVTLYVEQWMRLIAAVPALQAFIEAHQGEFARKKKD